MSDHYTIEPFEDGIKILDTLTGITKTYHFDINKWVIGNVTSNKRKVIYHEWDRPIDSHNRYSRVPKGEAIFHQFGVNYEEFETGPGNYTSAVIELPDGTIKNVPVEMITFINDLDCEEETHG